MPVTSCLLLYPGVHYPARVHLPYTVLGTPRPPPSSRCTGDRCIDARLREELACQSPAHSLPQGTVFQASSDQSCHASSRVTDGLQRGVKDGIER